MKTEEMKVADLIPYERNAKKHDDRQISNVMESIRQFGFAQPIVVDENNVVIIGHCRLIAAKRLGLRKVPVLKMQLDEEQAQKLRLLDNKLNESDWDIELLTEDIPELDWEGFDVDWDLPDWFSDRQKNDNSRQDGNDEYNAFLDKFEQKKTTDDCYTPDNIYEAVAEWCATEYKVNRKNFVRPFYPGGSYQDKKYKDTDIVVDNPPFSILAEILNWYTQKKIKFFLFGPSLTLVTATKCDLTYITCGAQITYENGADVSTGFITNLDSEYRLRTAPDLWEKIKEQNDINLREKTAELPNYVYPDHVICPAQIMKIARYGTDLRVKKEDCVIISELDEQKKQGRAIFGKGLLLSKKAAAEKAAAEKAAAEKAAAEKAAAEKAAAIKWQLSEREKKIVEELGCKKKK